MLPELQLRTIANLGPGTFNEMAAISHFGEEAVKHLGVPAADNTTVVEWVAAGMVSYGVVSIANTNGPSIDTIDALYQAWENKMPVYPQASIIVPVTHNLIVIPGTKLDEIRSVYAHPESLKQCRNTLLRYLPDNPTFIPTANTSQAVERMMKDGDKTTAAIGSVKAAEIWDAEIAIPEANDREDNRTQFLVLSNKTDHEPTGSDQTMISFSTKNESGSLNAALGVLAKHNLNISFLFNRSQDLGIYAFFLAIFDGHARSAEGQKAIAELKKVADSVYVLGSYPTTTAKL